MFNTSELTRRNTQAALRQAAAVPDSEMLSTEVVGNVTKSECMFINRGAPKFTRRPLDAPCAPARPGAFKPSNPRSFTRVDGHCGKSGRRAPLVHNLPRGRLPNSLLQLVPVQQARAARDQTRRSSRMARGYVYFSPFRVLTHHFAQTAPLRTPPPLGSRIRTPEEHVSGGEITRGECAKLSKHLISSCVFLPPRPLNRRHASPLQVRHAGPPAASLQRPLAGVAASRPEPLRERGLGALHPSGARSLDEAFNEGMFS
ncbi:hypothetical protein M885DRAFT_264483 [Pelagophyceae sp. CCMP2097]|nr:hypothetical protein M885DRAFT_264483 [Pelagophyceae sp. CCMP2097]